MACLLAWCRGPRTTVHEVQMRLKALAESGNRYAARLLQKHRAQEAGCSACAPAVQQQRRKT